MPTSTYRIEIIYTDEEIKRNAEHAFDKDIEVFRAKLEQLGNSIVITKS